jgi:hypothetical protein
MTNLVRKDLSPLGGDDIGVTFYPPSKSPSMPHDEPSFRWQELVSDPT